MISDINFNKNEIMKHPDGNRVFIGCLNGYLYEYSLKEKRIVHDFGKVADMTICSMSITLDNKYLLVCDKNGVFKEFHLKTYKQVKTFGVENADICVVTNNNQFLITSPTGSNGKLTKHSIQTKQQLYTWDKHANKEVWS